MLGRNIFLEKREFFVKFGKKNMKRCINKR